ncbi:MAG: dockerin type I repeat-containing protein, partial [Ruminococcus sp.]|nr:dockerin type I repeat-containing protein [Ruminococcus sp.]
TNLLFESGLSIFVGKTYSSSENHDDDFYSIEEIASTNPEIIDMIIERQLTQRVGYIGDADCDGEITVLDATTIQQYLAKHNTLKVELASDVDDNGSVDVIDATILQMNLASIE